MYEYFLYQVFGGGAADQPEGVPHAVQQAEEAGQRTEPRQPLHEQHHVRRQGGNGPWRALRKVVL